MNLQMKGKKRNTPFPIQGTLPLQILHYECQIPACHGNNLRAVVVHRLRVYTCFVQREMQICGYEMFHFKFFLC